VVAPSKRPFHTIIPAFVTRRGESAMSFGVMGGHMQPQGHVQALVRMLDFDQSPQAACDAPRWRFDGGLDVGVEPHMAADTVQALRGLGHRIAMSGAPADGVPSTAPQGDARPCSGAAERGGRGADSYQDFGAGQFIWRLGDPAVEGYVAASDPRRDGAAVGA
jgi:gamma-glutamyltranspeptidase/glutathione hydrolase